MEAKIKFLDYVNSIIIQKNDEYSTEDSYYNFKVGSKILNCSPEKVALSYMAKHIASLSKMVENPDSYSLAIWNEKLGDIACYCANIFGMRAAASRKKDLNE